ncbi:hypothetical protein Aaci_1536 [Alicyclobacillus acidocaldarius subsp. acidocaldarius DSM 446]|uniref:Glycine zipper domain-containing protein n=2 Tax=Alicyclobacillus acidocaldarius TaxID=405212 RepID=C8WWT0_ALIAD|nr:hypothetical protein Aaci_1536 [Alicyclobacillus acidocaldarius subsp. acidocaldarius DSM 446]
MVRDSQHPDQLQSMVTAFFMEYHIGKLLRQSNITKQAGIPVLEVFRLLFALVFHQRSLKRVLEQLAMNQFGKDTVYRFLNSPRHNWRRFLLLLSSAVVRRTARLTSEDRADVFIVDDSLFSRSRSKKVELLAKVYDHVLRSNLLTEQPASIPSGDYYFDGMVYSPAGVNRPYAHPDKGYYGISPYVTWHRVGNQDLHCQIDYYDSQSILEAPAWAVGSGVGALVGGMVTDGNLTGSVIGAIIGGALGAYYGAQVERLADENGCIWFTIDNNPPIVNLGTWWAPEWYMDVRYIELGPWATTNFYYYLGGVY